MIIKLILTIAACLFILGLSIFILYGNPLTRSKSVNQAENYLKEKYPNKSFDIKEVNYYPGEKVFILYVVSKDEKIKGNLDVKEGKIIHDELMILGK